jgi:hypothetical protein
MSCLALVVALTTALATTALGAPLTTRIVFGALGDSVTLVKTPTTTATTSNTSLSVGEAFNLQFDFQTFEITSISWQSSPAVTALINAAKAKGVFPLFVVRGALISLANVDTVAFTSLGQRLGQYIASLSGVPRVHVVFEPEFNTNSVLRNAGGSFAQAVINAASALKSAAGAAAFPVRVGQGWLVSRTATYSDQLAEFRLLASSGALSSDTSKLDFVSPVWRFTAIGGDPARLAVLPCQLHGIVRFATRELSLETFVAYIDITNPPTDTNWLAANIKLADELRGLVAPLYFDGLRGIGLRTIVCPSSDTVACMLRCDRTSSGAAVETSLLLKGDSQAWRSWMLVERSEDRSRSLTQSPPRFSCAEIVPLKSGLVYLDNLIAWDNGGWGWVDASPSTLVRNFSSTEIVNDGSKALRVRFDSVGQRLRFEYRSPWPLSPIGAGEFTHFVFDIYSESIEPVSLPISVRVDDSGSAVAISSVATRQFGAKQWQRIVIPRSSLLSSSAFATAITLTVLTPPAAPIVLFFDRIAFDATALPCDFAQPQLGCNKLVLDTPSVTPMPPVVARCGNNMVEGNEQCDGGACCINCMLRPAGTPCSAVRSNDPCDIADVCDGNSGGCKDQFKPVGTACNDGDDRCTSNDTCRSNGKCAGVFTCACNGSDSACETDADRCTMDKCGADNKCSSTPTIGGIMCDDKDPCTDNDVCDGMGSCRGKPGLCSKPTPRPPPVGPPPGCTPGQSHLCTCQAPDDYCAPPLTCKVGICYRPELQTAKACDLADFGKVSGCPCEPPPSLYCKPPLTCDKATENCVGTGGDTPSPTSGSSDTTVTPGEVVAANSVTVSLTTVLVAVLFNVLVVQ